MSKQQKRSRSQSGWLSRFKPVQLALGAVALAVIALIALIALSQLSARSPQLGSVQSDQGTSPPDQAVRPAQNCPNLVSGYLSTMGSPEAPIEIIEFSDYQCPVCGRFAKDYEPPMIRDFVCTGKVRFTYKDFAFIGSESKIAAQAANCAADQGKFWEYHDKLFANQRGENRGNFNEKKLKGFAADLKLDLDKFSHCLDSGKYADQLVKTLQEGKSRGVNATPTFFVNGQEVRGLPASYDDLVKLIEKALNNS